MTATPDFSIRMQVAGMLGLLSEIIAVGALSKHGDTDLMERVREAADTPLPELPSRSCLAQIEEPAQPIAGYRISDPSDPTIKPWLSETPDDNGYTSEPLYARAAPAAVAPQDERQWICPTRTVADLVNNLLTMDQALPIYGAQYIERDGRRCAIAVPPTVSRERVKDGRWIGQGEELNAAVVWTRAEQPAAAPGLTDGQLDDESYRVNDEPGFSDAFRAGARFAERVHGVTASAARAVTGKADWWRGRADEIEVQVARSGSQEAMRCYTDMRTLLQAAAPALEAPAAPAGWKLVPEKPTDAMLGAAQKAWLADPLRRSSTLYAAALAAAPQAPAAMDELRQIADIAACWGCDHPDQPGDTELLRRVKWAARQLSDVAQAPAAPSDAQLLSEWDRVSGITKATERRLACMRAVLKRWGSAAPAAPVVDSGAYAALPATVAYSLGLAKYAHSSNIIAAQEFTPDAEHADEWESLVTLDQARAFADATHALRIAVAAPAAPAVEASGAVPVVLGKKLFQFNCHQDWVNRAQRAWKMAGVRSEDTICLDQKGRVLRKGLEFARADKEGAFPVVVYLALLDDTASHDAWLAAQTKEGGAQ